MSFSWFYDNPVYLHPLRDVVSKYDLKLAFTLWSFLMFYSAFILMTLTAKGRRVSTGALGSGEEHIIAHWNQGGGQGARALHILTATNKSAFSTNTQSRFASVVLDGVLGPAPRPPHLTHIKLLQ